MTTKSQSKTLGLLLSMVAAMATGETLAPPEYNRTAQPTQYQLAFDDNNCGRWERECRQLCDYETSFENNKYDRDNKFNWCMTSCMASHNC